MYEHLRDASLEAREEAIRRAMSGLGLADQRTAIALLKTLGVEAAALPITGS